MTGQEKERAAIARELHDEFGQMLTALHMDSAWMREHFKETDPLAAERALTMCTVIDKTIDEIRSLARRLRPGALDHLGLIDALEMHTADFEKRTGIICSFKHLKVPHLHDGLATTAYRIAQEALTNVARHSSADHVMVSLYTKESFLMLSVKDNGCGFDTQGLSGSYCLGILGMQERANLIGGSLKIISQPEHGTKVHFKANINAGEAR